METLPPIRSSVSDFGEIRRPGFTAPLRASVVDQAASLYGHGCRRRGDAKVTFGTGAFALALTGELPADPRATGLVSTAVWQVGGRTSYALDGGVYNASSAVDWARRLGLFSDFAEIDTFQAAPAIARDIAFVPALSGLACPHWDRRAAGLWLGLSLDTTRSDMMQAVLEGVALRAAEVVATINAIAPVGDTLSIDGGLSANRYFCQFLADILGREIRVPSLSELTAAGAAAVIGAELEGEGPARIVTPGTIDRDRLRTRFSEAVARAGGWKQAKTH